MGTAAAVQKNALEAILRRVEGLERRVAELEGQAAKPVEQHAAPQVYAQQTPAPPGVHASSLSLSGGAFAAAAKALLGFAGAYLIRAVAESGSIPHWIGILAGLIYAVFWLVWATRQNPADRLASTLFGLTATLIFSGLVWESSVRFQQVGPSGSAVIIAGFSGLGMFLARTRNLPVVSGIVRAVAAVLALALLFATHNMVPYTAVILVIAAAGEFAACHDVLLNQRWIGALAADLAVFFTAWVITRPQGLPEHYPVFGMTESAVLQMALVMIYVMAMSYRTLALRADITNFETVQNAAAIGLFLWGSVLAGREAAAARISVEGFCVLAGTLCYVAAVLFLARRERLRNFLMYGFFGLALLMAGVSILFSGFTLVVAWCALAIITAWLGTHEHQMSLQLHSPVYLAAAAVTSGLVGFAAHALHGSAPPSGARLFEIVLTTVALAICYWLEDIGGTGKARLPAALIAALLCWSLLGLGGAGITSTLGPDSFISSTLRTGLICAVALGLAKGAARRQECTWLIFPLMLYGGYRLLVEDFPNGRPTALALSLLFYGGTLLLLTRMMRAPQAAEQ